MAIKDLDFLSPKITLYYYGSKRHKSLVGSIMTLIIWERYLHTQKKELSLKQIKTFIFFG